MDPRQPRDARPAMPPHPGAAPRGMRWVADPIGGRWVLDAALPVRFRDRAWVRRLCTGFACLVAATAVGAAGAWVFTRAVPPPAPPPGPCERAVLQGLSAGTLTGDAHGLPCSTPAGTWVVWDERADGVRLVSGEQFGRILEDAAAEALICDQSGVGGSTVCS
jgi:hypothetical protein